MAFSSISLICQLIIAVWIVYRIFMPIHACVFVCRVNISCGIMGVDCEWHLALDFHTPEVPEWDACSIKFIVCVETYMS